MFDLRPEGVVSDLPEKRKNKIMNSIAKSEIKRSSFTYLSYELGKEKRNSLTSVVEKTEGGRIIRTACEREDVEQTLIEYNRHHFQ